MSLSCQGWLDSSERVAVVVAQLLSGVVGALASWNRLLVAQLLCRMVAAAV